MTKNNNNSLLFAHLTLVSIALIAFLFISYFRDQSVEKSVNAVSSTTPFLCDSDAKICPDGTIVGRTGDKCEFMPCPGVLPVKNTLPLKKTTLYGSVTLSPTCPVERVEPLPKCSPKPYVTEVTAFDETTFELVASTKTSNAGTFVLNLLPGNYTIRARDGEVFPRCTEMIVRLLENSTSSITISCDSGIR